MTSREGPRGEPGGLCLRYMPLPSRHPEPVSPLKSEVGEEKANPVSGIRNRAKSLKTLGRDQF